MKILAFLFFLFSTPALACSPFMPLVKEAMGVFSIVEHTLSGADVPIFLKSNFNIDSRGNILLILIDPTDGEILLVGGIDSCVEGHARKQTPSVEAARMLVGTWLENYEKARKLQEDKGKS